MNPKIRDLIFRAMDNEKSGDMLHLMQTLYNFRYHEDILKWLIQHNMTGKILSNWFRFNFKYSVFDLVKYVVQQINGEKMDKILIGRDWVV